MDMFPMVVELRFGHAAFALEIVEDLMVFLLFHGFGCCCRVSGGCGDISGVLARMYTEYHGFLKGLFYDR